MLRSSSKHGQHELHTREQVPYLVEALRSLVGGEAAVRERHPGLAHLLPGRAAHPRRADARRLPRARRAGPAGDVHADADPGHDRAGQPPRQRRPGQRRGALDHRRLPARPSRPAARLQQRDRLDGLPHRRVPRRDAGDGPPVGGAHDDGPLLRPSGRPAPAAPPTPTRRGPRPSSRSSSTMLPPMSAGADIVVGFGRDRGRPDPGARADPGRQRARPLLRAPRRGDRRRPAIPTSSEEVAEVGPGGNFLVSKRTRRAARSGEFLGPRCSDASRTTPGSRRARRRSTSALASRSARSSRRRWSTRCPTPSTPSSERLLATADRELA